MLWGIWHIYNNRMGVDMQRVVCLSMCPRGNSVPMRYIKDLCMPVLSACAGTWVGRARAARCNVPTRIRG